MKNFDSQLTFDKPAACNRYACEASPIPEEIRQKLAHRTFAPNADAPAALQPLPRTIPGSQEP